MSLTVGHITYANCVPFFFYLRQEGFTGHIHPGVPAELNSLLCRGEVDVSPSSSFEFARHWRSYLLLPGHSISSLGPVQSVLLFSPRPPQELSGAEVALTGESATSVNLLKILLWEYFGVEEVSCRVPDEPVESIIAAGGSGLLIGDRALKAAQKAEPGRVYDLGALWYRFTGLPFVFALWILRQDAARAKAREVEEFLSQLGRSRVRALNDLDRVARAVPEGGWLGQQGLVDYWRTMSYDLGPDHLKGLRLYFQLAVKYGLLEEEPQLRFFEPGSPA